MPSQNKLTKGLCILPPCFQGGKIQVQFLGSEGKKMKETRTVKDAQRGMFTVEAALIMPLILFSIFGVIFLSTIHYQNFVATAESIRSANRIAAYWSYIGVDNPPALISGTPAEQLITVNSYAARSPYRFISETLATAGGKRLDNGEKYAKTRIAGIPFQVYAEGQADVEVSADYGFLSSYIVVSAKKTYINPLGALMEQIGIGETEERKSTAKALITNPSEFIRNVDILYDVGQGIIPNEPKSGKSE